MSLKLGSTRQGSALTMWLTIPKISLLHYVKSTLGLFFSIHLAFISHLHFTLALAWRHHGYRKNPGVVPCPPFFPPIPQPNQCCRPNSNKGAAHSLPSGCTPQLVPAVIRPQGARAHTGESCRAPCFPFSQSSTQSYPLLWNSDHTPQTFQGASCRPEKILQSPPQGLWAAPFFPATLPVSQGLDCWRLFHLFYPLLKMFHPHFYRAHCHIIWKDTQRLPWPPIPPTPVSNLSCLALFSPHLYHQLLLIHASSSSGLSPILKCKLCEDRLPPHPRPSGLSSVLIAPGVGWATQQAPSKYLWDEHTRTSVSPDKDQIVKATKIEHKCTFVLFQSYNLITKNSSQTHRCSCNMQDRNSIEVLQKILTRSNLEGKRLRKAF